LRLNNDRNEFRGFLKHPLECFIDVIIGSIEDVVLLTACLQVKNGRHLLDVKGTHGGLIMHDEEKSLLTIGLFKVRVKTVEDLLVYNALLRLRVKELNKDRLLRLLA
jgi:hypothetical protein